MTKSVTWAPADSLAQIREYYFYDTETGEALSGLRARAQAKHDVLGKSWKETNRIMRACAATVPLSKHSREIFAASEKQALALEEPCLFLIGYYWRRAGGRGQRPEEDAIDAEELLEKEAQADVDTTDSSSDESSDTGDDLSDREDLNLDISAFCDLQEITEEQENNADDDDWTMITNDDLKSQTNTANEEQGRIIRVFESAPSTMTRLAAHAGTLWAQLPQLPKFGAQTQDTQQTATVAEGKTIESKTNADWHFVNKHEVVRAQLGSRGQLAW